MFIKLMLSKQAVNRVQQRGKILQQAKKYIKTKNSHQKALQFQPADLSTNQNTPAQNNGEQQFFSINANTKKYYFKVSMKTDIHRHSLAYEDGGLTCDDPKQIDKLRSVGKQMIKIIGRKILSGEFNLTKISIPIKSCYPKTALYNSVKGYSIFPYFMTSASQEKDPLERFKITLTCLLAQPYYLNMFLKPLNPILGETLQASLPDGTQIYAQQISHHPPISYFLIVGADDSYRFSGYYDVEVHPGMNSLTIKNKGKRKFAFKDSTQIETTYATNQFSSTFFGTSRIEQIGSFEVEDKKNRIKCTIEFGKVKKKPSDYFKAQIYSNDRPVSTVEGTCLGFVEIDSRRYWDGRDLENLQFDFGEKWERLPSDWEFREDLQMLHKGDLKKAQILKEKLEELQRTDAKLRKKHKDQKH